MFSALLQSSPTKSPKRKEPTSEKNKKKPTPVTNKKSGFVTNANAKPRPISDEDSEHDAAASKKKGGAASSRKPGVSKQQQPKVVPKKSATAKPIMKGNLSKSKQFVDTESESEIEEVKQISKHSSSNSKNKKALPVKKGKLKSK